MIYVEAPEILSLELLTSDIPKIFLAGGITGCPDWQKLVVEKLECDLHIAVVFNPRREDFPIDNPNAALEQITWEYYYLNNSDLITYWFTEETIQPIVLFELGRFINSDKELIISAHRNYPRRKDVEIQVRLARGGCGKQPLAYHLEDHVNQIIRWYRNR